MKQCWTCKRTSKEINKYINEVWDDRHFLEVPTYKNDPDYVLSNPFLKDSIYICQICWGLHQASFEHEFFMVKEVINEILPEEWAILVLDSLDFQGMGKNPTSKTKEKTKPPVKE